MTENSNEQKRIIHWNKRLEEYFSSTGEKAHCLSWLHKKSEALFSWVTVFIDLPVIIISGIVGAVSIGTDSLFGPDTKASVVLGALSIFVGILNTIGTYFAWGKRAELHRVSSIQYSRLYRHMQVEMSLPRIERTTPDELLKYVRNEYERLSEISPLLPKSVIKKFNELFKDEKEISQPEEVNGLEKIEVYRGGIEDFTLPPDVTPENITETVVIPPMEEIIGVKIEAEKIKDEKREEEEESPEKVLPPLKEINKKKSGNSITWK